MSSGLKATWQRLKQAAPGSRFQNEYHVHRETSRGKWSRVLSIAASVVIVAVGIVALPAPGPGFLVIAVGAALLARESLAIARAADWVELRLRDVIKWAHTWWKGAGWAARSAVLVLALMVAGLAGYLAYERFFA